MMKSKQNIDDPSSIYQIKVQGQLETRWSDWFDGFTITCAGDQTVLTGLVIDQAALRGLLNKIWDLNLTLISLERVETNLP
jgi:hypothetical protein